MEGYLKKNSIGDTATALPNDVLGNTYVFTTIGTNQVSISPTTKTALADVGLDWGAY
jgi:hypothetical protein